MTARTRHAVGFSVVAGMASLALLAAPAVGPGAGAQARRALSALAASSSTPQAAGTDAAAGQLGNDEVVIATLGPSGLPDEVVLVSRLVSTDGPERMVADPASVTNVKYLDRLGRPDTEGTNVLLPAGGRGRHIVLTQARFDEPLPVAMHAQYEIDGQVVPPEAVPGSAGEVRTTYTLTNTTAAEQELHFEDAAGSAHSQTEPVFAPFAGSAVVTVAADTEVLSAPGAVRYSDPAGNTVLAWNVSLYPPLTSYQQELKLRTRAPRASIPSVAVSLTPVTAKQDPAVGFSADLLAGAVDGNTDLYAGLRELDDQAATLADGAGALAGGLGQLAGGAGTASSATDALAGGLAELGSGADQVASGNQQLADALAQAATGAQRLADGTAELARADTDAAGAALDQLATAVSGLEQGARTLAQRFGSSADPPLPSPLPSPDADNKCTTEPATGVASGPSGTTNTPAGAGGSDAGEGGLPASPPPTPSPTPSSFDDDCITLYQAVRALIAGLGELSPLVAAINTEVTSANTAAQSLASSLGSIGTDSGTAAAGAAALSAQLCGAQPQLPAPTCAALLGVAQSAGRAAQTTAGLTPTVTSLLTSLGKLAAYGPVLEQAIAGAQQAGTKLLVGMDAVAAGLTGTEQAPGLVTGLEQVGDGLGLFADGLQDSSQQLAQALDALSGGTQQLADGIDQAAGGADQLATGADQVANGMTQAADGAGQLSTGIAELAAGADAVAAGGAQLASGATAFQQQGTAKAAESVLDASTDPALAQAWLAAAGRRAADAMPYGPPEGATGHVAYLLDIPGQPAPEPGLWERIKGWLTR